MTARRLVIIGGDAAGMSAASLAKRRRPDLEIEAYEMGEFTSYGACGMPYYVAGQIPELEDLVVVSPSEFETKRGIKVFTSHLVESINPDKKSISVKNLKNSDVREVPYDDLMIAVGAEPIIPRGINLDLPGVFTLRGLPDAEEIKQYALKSSSKKAVIIGKGYIAMEMAEALVAQGVKTTVMGRRPGVLPNFEPEIGALVVDELEKQRVEILQDAEIKTMKAEASGIELTLTDGRILKADIVVVGAGVKPRSELAEKAGLELGSKKAVKVDRRQRTSHDNIWSAGDCAEAYHLLLKRNVYIPLALSANRQGRIAGNDIVGLPAEFPGVLGTAVCKIIDLTAARTGLGFQEALDEGLDVEKVQVTSRSRAHYYPGGSKILSVLIVEKGSRKLWGAQMAGADGVAQRINTWVAALTAGMTLEEIHALDLAYAPPFSPVWDPVLIASEIAMKKVK